MGKDIVHAEFGKAEAKVASRAIYCRDRLRAIKEHVEGEFLETCSLLLEAKEQNYNLIFGYANFGDWVEEESGLEMKARNAYYYTQIAKVIRDLNLSKRQVKEIGVSKLRAICGLDSEEFGKEIRHLLEAAPDLSIDEVNDEVRKVSGKPPMRFMTIKVEPAVKEIVEEAFELARRNYGNTIQDGEEVEISDSKALELICADYLQDPNNFPS